MGLGCGDAGEPVELNAQQLACELDLVRGRGRGRGRVRVG